MKHYIVWLAIVFLFLFSCKSVDVDVVDDVDVGVIDGGNVDGGNVDVGEGDETPELQFSASEKPFDLGFGANFYGDIAYGGHERNRFDLFAPDVGSGGVGLVVVIHGGGFTGGDKSVFYGDEGFRALVSYMLSKNIAVANVNYRFLEAGDGRGVERSLNDSKEALQFIKYYSEELGVNKDKIVLMGSSAGAGTSLWIGLNDDLAVEDAGNLVLRESTRVQGIVGLSTQSSYDIVEWHNSTFHQYRDEGMNFEAVLALTGEDTLLKFYGIDALDEVYSADVVARRKRLDMLGLMSGDDPDIYLSSSDIANDFPTDHEELLHHPLHAKAVLDRAVEEGVVCKAFMPQMGVDTTGGESMADFIVRVLEG